jgi:hypothetical protein
MTDDSTTRDPKLEALKPCPFCKSPDVLRGDALTAMQVLYFATKAARESVRRTNDYVEQNNLSWPCRHYIARVRVVDPGPTPTSIEGEQP